MEDSARQILAGTVAKWQFDIGLFPWRYAVCTALGSHEPERVHEFMPRLSGDDHKRLQGTVWHQRFYAQFDAIVRPLYLQFLPWVAERLDISTSDLVYQARPTLRIQSPGDYAVHQWHRDRDYGHAQGEINIWLPITEAVGSSTVWVSDSPQNASYGEVIVFDGTNVLHGNTVNDTGKSRVSIDFRVAGNGFVPSGSASAASNRKFTIGPSYFEVF